MKHAVKNNLNPNSPEAGKGGSGFVEILDFLFLSISYIYTHLEVLGAQGAQGAQGARGVLAGVPCDLCPMWERLSHCLSEALHSAPCPHGHLMAPLDHGRLWMERPEGKKDSRKGQMEDIDDKKREGEEVRGGQRGKGSRTKTKHIISERDD